MGQKTGNPRGRPPGTNGRRKIARDVAIRQAQKIIDESVPRAFEGDAHAFLISIYKDPAQEVGHRLQAANTAIKFEKPALQAVQLSGKDGGPIQLSLIDRLNRGISRVKGSGNTE